MSGLMLIGLAGPAGAGKSCAARLLEGYAWRRVSFAEPIKAMVADGLGVDRPELERLKRTNKSTRNWLRVVGDHWRRADPDVFMRVARGRWLSAMADEAMAVVVDDVRFEPEADAIRRDGGTIIHVDRSGVGFAMDHASERGVRFAQWDRRLRNDGDRAALRCDLMALVAQLRRPASRPAA